jgi:hypothetical protein
MRQLSPLLRCVTGVLIASTFAMCTKESIEKPVAVNSIRATPEALEVEASALNAIRGFTYTVKPSDWFVDGAKFPAGATILIPAGTRGALLLKNLHGTTARPITIINQGKVVIKADLSAGYAFKTQNCQFFKILGNRTNGIPYGLEVIGGNIGVTIDDLSSDVEISNVEVHGQGFAGIMAKTDPSCDVATWRGHFTMRNVIFHDNYVHNTGGEGFYVGNSFYADGRSLSCGTVMPHDLINVRIYNNRTTATGCEGIQVGGAISQCEIFNNQVTSPGLTPFANAQDNGIQIGEGTGGKCYNNVIRNAPGNGIIVLGLGDNLVYNNIIINSGAHGIFADSRFTPGHNFKFINNTIIEPAGDGIKLNSETIKMNTVINNVIIKPGSGIGIHKISNDVKLTAIGNYIGNDINLCKFVNVSEGNFHLLSSSPLINRGANVSTYGINLDYYSRPRPYAKKFDIGATEYRNVIQ